MKPKSNFGKRGRTAPASSRNWRPCRGMLMFKFRFPFFVSPRPNSRHLRVHSRIRATLSRRPCVQPARRRWTEFLKPMRRGRRCREAVRQATRPVGFMAMMAGRLASLLGWSPQSVDRIYHSDRILRRPRARRSGVRAQRQARVRAGRAGAELRTARRSSSSGHTVK
jgi:hypothetical protein